MIKLVKMLKSEKGFTLIEMVFAVIILAVLAGIALVNLGSSEEDAKAAAVKSDMQAIATALKVYKAKTGDFPVTTDFDDLTTAQGKYQPMIDEIPDDPYASTAGTKYVYAHTANAATATITSVGPSGGSAITKTVR